MRLTINGQFWLKDVPKHRIGLRHEAWGFGKDRQVEPHLLLKSLCLAFYDFCMNSQYMTPEQAVESIGRLRDELGNARVTVETLDGQQSPAKE